jgi:hypothetical protein
MHTQRYAEQNLPMNDKLMNDKSGRLVVKKQYGG